MSVRIGLGTSGLAFSTGAVFWRWVDYCETHGIDSLWQSDRLVSRIPTLEPMSLLAALAGRTERMQFGMNAVVLPYRDPLVLAKECATIDFLSNGRLLPVFGVGNAADAEWKATGRERSERGRRSDEMLAIMTRLFEEESVDFDGKFYQYKNVSISPKPVRKPFPLWIGGDSEAAQKRTARFGTGWLGGFTTPAKAAEVVKGIKAALLETGRAIDLDHYGIVTGFRFGSREDAPVRRFIERITSRRAFEFDPTPHLAVGNAGEIAAQFARYVAVGVTKFVAVPLATDETDLMEQTKALREDVMPLIAEIPLPKEYP